MAPGTTSDRGVGRDVLDWVEVRINGDRISDRINGLVISPINGDILGL